MSLSSFLGISRLLDTLLLRRPNAFHSPTVDTALADAERNGFRLAAIGRTCALVAIAGFYLMALRHPNNIYVPGLLLAVAAAGLAPLALVSTRYERTGRYAFFTLDTIVVSAILAVVPLSMGGDVPQNLVFLSSRRDYYYIVVALSVLTLSPALVLWAGTCAAIGLAGTAGWVMAGMERVISLGDLPPSYSREDYIAVVLNPAFLGIPFLVNQGVVLVIVTSIAALAVHRARNVVRAHAAAEAERNRIHRIFGRFVPAQVAEQIIQAGQLAPQQRDATILFADIEGFTRLSQSLPPSGVIALVNSFFTAATTIINDQGGVVINYIGDALIAAFDAPVPVDRPAARAVHAARALLSLVSEREFEGYRVRLRIGVATGPVAAGTVGGGERQTYTLYGDTVNLAQRLEELNKEFGTDCLICGVTYRAAGLSSTDAGAMGSVQVRGRDYVVQVFALGGRQPTR